MTQEKKRIALIRALLAEQPRYAGLAVPTEEAEQHRLLRSLMNVRPPDPLAPELLRLQDAYLQGELLHRGVTELDDLTPLRDNLYLWQGDITLLRADAIVNAANSGMLGCFCPCHGCIDNAIHTYAGMQLRLACAEQMAAQGHDEPTGRAKLTPAFNLPCRFVLHTVGPIITEAVTSEDEALLADCYRACLALAAETGATSLAFCCISTGEFHFPPALAARIALHTVQADPAVQSGRMKVIFNVFKKQDYDLYAKLLGGV